MSGVRGLAEAFRAGLAGRAADGPLVAAVSGGRDSMVLLHLLRFAAGGTRPPVVVAHLDHAMREGSSADARWLSGVCRAWELPLRARRLAAAPEGEAAARAARYAFLEEVRRAEGAAAVLTAHHAADQAETVLFRALRGTGLRGLRGILEERAPGVWRPLLRHRPEELAAYAAAVGLSWREDPTNRLPLARNVIRRELLPRAADAVSADPVGALARLAEHAREDAEAWASLLPHLFEEIDLREEDGSGSWSVEALRALHPAVRARLLRALARRVGHRLSRAGTRVAMQVTSGRTSAPADLGGGLRMHAGHGRASFEPVRETGPDRTLPIGGPGCGRGHARLGGRTVRVEWREEPFEGAEPLAVARDAWPLEVRGWIAGDRVRLPYGTKKLKKLFLEARVPRPGRRRVPLVADRRGRILWVRSLARSVEAEAGEPTLHIRIVDAEDD